MGDESTEREDSSVSFDASNAPPPDSAPPEVSKEEQGGVPPDDMDANTPLGVGESLQGRGEDAGTKGSGGADRDAERHGGSEEQQ